MNAGDAVNLIELFARGADPKLAKNHELVRQLINEKLKDWSARTGSFETSATLNSVADQQEYQLPADKIHVKRVEFDSYKAYKITFDEAKALTENDS